MTALIVINYKKTDLTIRLLESLQGASAIGILKIIIVDNASEPSSEKLLREFRTKSQLQIEVLPEKENWGYFGGARVGLAHLKKTDVHPTWTIISNSDIEFSDPQFFQKLSSFDTEKDLGCLAPSIRSGLSSQDQNPYMHERPSKERMIFYKRVFRFKLTCFLYQLAGLAKSLLKKQKTSKPDLTSREIYAAHGSFLIFSQEYFKRGGDFAHKPFLFGEEITVAENCRRMGLKVIYARELVVHHAEHATMGWIPSAKTLEFQKEASEFCADTYFA